MTRLKVEELTAWAVAVGVRLSPERAAALVSEVDGLLAFTRELDAHVAPDVMPATVFDPEPANG